MTRRLLTALLILSLLVGVSSIFVLEQAGYAPRSLGPYIERRGNRHAPWIENSSAWVGRLLVAIDRGEQLPAQSYPEWIGARAERSGDDFISRSDVRVSTAPELVQALQQAKPGDHIILEPGQYLMRNSQRLHAAGTAEAPITVRARKLGDALLLMEGEEGFNVIGAHWRFENLHIRGICSMHGDCEHAFHIVAGARDVQLRNNRIEDFNAQIKINGHEGVYPDGGVIEGNSLTNSAPREAHRPVTPIDLVGASNWRIEGNLIADFIKQGGDNVSYGAFAKGAGSGNLFARNVVLCEHKLRGFRGQRVGLSLGGGGTGTYACRDGKCVVEQENSVLRHNLIAQCSDVGIYLNRAANSQIQSNTVFDTAGIDVRFAESSATATGNLIEGALRARDGGLLHQGDNARTMLWPAFLGWHDVRQRFVDAAGLDLHWRSDRPVNEAVEAAPARDLCGAIARPPVYGAFTDFADCLRKP